MKRLLVGIVVGFSVVGFPGVSPADDPPAAERPAPARGRRGPRDDPQFAADRDDFHFLLDNRASIRRTVTRLPDGVETVTESEDPGVADRIRAHVASMHGRVREGRGIHLRDPLFREVFRNAARISMEVTATEQGVRVVEKSEDPFVAILIQAHADVVSRFLEHGHEEVRRNHPVPPRPR